MICIDGAVTPVAPDDLVALGTPKPIRDEVRRSKRRLRFLLLRSRCASFSSKCASVCLSRAISERRCRRDASKLAMSAFKVWL